MNLTSLPSNFGEGNKNRVMELISPLAQLLFQKYMNTPSDDQKQQVASNLNTIAGIPKTVDQTAEVPTSIAKPDAVPSYSDSNNTIPDYLRSENPGRVALESMLTNGTTAKGQPEAPSTVPVTSARVNPKAFTSDTFSGMDRPALEKLQSEAIINKMFNPHLMTLQSLLAGQVVNGQRTIEDASTINNPIRNAEAKGDLDSAQKIKQAETPARYSGETIIGADGKTERVVRNVYDPTGTPTGVVGSTRDPLDAARLRATALMRMKMTPVWDTESNRLTFMDASGKEIAGGRFAPPSQAQKAMGQKTLMEDIRGSINQTRTSLDSLPEFDQELSAKAAMLLKRTDSRSAIGAFVKNEVGKSLTAEQADYLTNLATLKEVGMSMRSILGAGQGSDDLRDAFTQAIPNAVTPNKTYAYMQLDKLERTLDRLGEGVPTNIKLNSQLKGNNAASAQSSGNASPKVITWKRNPTTGQLEQVSQ